jgi:hypothetical protein
MINFFKSELIYIYIYIYMMKSSFNNEKKYTKCIYGSMCFYQINREKMQISLIFRKGDNFFMA